ncbi:hypothetical protein PRIPAC_89183 [Pristionchus pacificus]|uniref:Protein kinase domain-containing protein n=1 Tax=Pristionchus pacificus TaxID=54126 RepID=A0A2A6CWJ8_PRIPA|nr:hypothetical protein PRIPAC_89183 [Pristionchus pacificus]|eukprot:PDM82508.1 protein kinase [Pristionchus pacificus]
MLRFLKNFKTTRMESHNHFDIFITEKVLNDVKWEGAVERFHLKKREHAAVLLEIFAKHESFMFISAWIEEPPSRWQVRLIDFDIQGDEKRTSGSSVVQDSIGKATAVAQPQPSEATHDFQSKFLKNFKPTEILGEGGFGIVFEVEVKLIGTAKMKRAIKRIPIESTREVNKAMREVKELNRLKPGKIVHHFDSWIENPPEGWQNEVDDKIFEELNYTPKNYCPDNCLFLYIHMEPSNILFDDENRLKLCDFGIVTDRKYYWLREKSVERTGNIGTQMYMAPEQSGSLYTMYTAKVDIFAIGLVLTRMCVVMTRNEAEEAFNDYRRGRASPVLDHLPKIKDLVSLLTKVDPADRPTADELCKYPLLEEHCARYLERTVKLLQAQNY